MLFGPNGMFLLQYLEWPLRKRGASILIDKSIVATLMTTIGLAVTREFGLLLFAGVSHVVQMCGSWFSTFCFVPF